MTILNVFISLQVESVDSSHHMLYTEYHVYSRYLQKVAGFARVHRWAHTKRYIFYRNGF